MNSDKKSKHKSEKNTLIIAVMISGVFLAVLNQTVLSPALPSIMAVSYTHLDVYKRQIICISFQKLV